MSLAAVLFLGATLAVLYTYALYPLLLRAIAKRGVEPFSNPLSLGERGEGVEDYLPSVSVIIPFCNEERWVRRKLENTLSWDYPADRLEIIAVSDGSTDRTNETLHEYKDRVRVVVYHPRQGKPTALNRGVAEAQGDILIFTDANVLIERQAIRPAVACYRDPSIGGVSGNIALHSEGSAEPLGEGLYMRYERWLYKLDSRVGTMVGTDGAYFAIRRELFSPLFSDTIVDDFAIALGVIAKGKRVVYESEARGAEMVVPNVRAEFRRKVRMIAGGYQALWRYRRLLNPVQFPIVSLQLLSHKLLRWLVPAFLVITLVASSIGARDHNVLAMALVLQGVFYALAGLGWVSGRLRRWVLVYVPYYFCAVNLAAAMGLWRWVRGGQAITWQKVSR